MCICWENFIIQDVGRANITTVKLGIGKKMDLLLRKKSEPVSECKLSTRTSGKVGEIHDWVLAEGLYKKDNPQPHPQSNEAIKAQTNFEIKVLEFSWPP